MIFPEDGTSAGTLTLSDAWDDALEPAPVTPTGEDSAPWQLFSGTIKATYDAHRGLDGADNIFVAPGIMAGNSGGNLRAGTSAVKPRLTYMGCDPGSQIRRSIGNSRATSSGITIRKENTDSIRSTNVCYDFVFNFGLGVLISPTDIIADNFVEMIRFFTTLILNVDESRKM